MTPFPWKVGNWENYNPRVVFHEPSDENASYIPVAQFESEDDAILGAAAPALLAAAIDAEAAMAQHVYPVPDRGPEHPWNVLQRLRAAIAAARPAKGEPKP